MAYTNIDDPSAYFQTVLHSSANSATITNDGNSNLQPDLIWSKARGATHNHGLYDSTRGVTKFLSSNTTSAETTASSGYDLTSFNTDGFSTGNNQYNTICGGTTYVAWQWKANGGTTASNTDGAITSTVQANTTAGFSIVSYAGNSNNPSSVGHGLGVKPEFYVIRQRSGNAWKVYHSGITATDPEDYVLEFNTNAKEDNAIWNDTGPTSSVINFTDHGAVNQSGENYIAYCWASVKGYSKFGSYIANGNAKGPFVHTGFKPRFVILKNITNSGYLWWMLDSKRNEFNLTDTIMYVDGNYSDFDGSGHATNMGVDFLSNGFKVRTANTGINNNGGTTIYMAWAENPFVTSTGTPTTAN